MECSDTIRFVVIGRTIDYVEESLIYRNHSEISIFFSEFYVGIATVKLKSFGKLLLTELSRYGLFKLFFSKIRIFSSD